MKPLITEQIYKDVEHKIESAVQRLIYHHPKTGYLCGWAFSIVNNGALVLVEGIRLIENIALSVLNVAAYAFSEKAKKDFKATLINVKKCAIRIIILSTFMLIWDAVEYTRQPNKNADLVKKYQWKELHFAAAYDDTNLLNKVIRSGFDVNTLTEHRNTTYFESALHLAVKYNSVNAISMLMLAKANPAALNTYEERPLDIAVMRENIPAIEVLVDGGADVNAKQDGLTALHFAVTSEHETKRFSTIKYARNSYEEVINTLIKKGARVDESGSSGWTPLMSAVADNKIDSIHALLSHGANLNFAAQAGTVLHLALVRSNLETLKALLQYDVLNANAQDGKGWTALHYASLKANDSFLRALINRKDLNPNLQDHEGSTALHLAHQRWIVGKQQGELDNLNILKELVNPQIRDYNGKRAEDYQSASELYKPTMTLKEKVGRNIFCDEAYNCFAKSSRISSGYIDTSIVDPYVVKHD